MRRMPEFVLALTTFPAAADALAFAQSLVEARLAACVHVLPAVQSVYTWEGAVATAPEQPLVIKTTRERVEALQSAIQAAHPYTLPEFLVLPVIGGSPGYLEWLDGAVGRDAGS
jgi:periplasmic divalent cation tolerance protein